MNTLTTLAAGDTVPIDNIQAWTFLVALVTPYLVALISRPSFSKSTQRLLMIGISVVVAGGLRILQGDLDKFQWDNFLPYLVVFIGAVQVAYAALKAIPITSQSLDQVLVASSPGVDADRALAQKAAVNTSGERQFAKNVGALKRR